MICLLKTGCASYLVLSAGPARTSHWMRDREQPHRDPRYFVDPAPIRAESKSRLLAGSLVGLLKQLPDNHDGGDTDRQHSPNSEHQTSPILSKHFAPLHCFLCEGEYSGKG